MKKFAWDVEHRSGYFDYKWKRDDAGDLLLPDEVKEYYGINELKVLEGGIYASSDM